MVYYLVQYKMIILVSLLLKEKKILSEWTGMSSRKGLEYALCKKRWKSRNSEWSRPQIIISGFYRSQIYKTMEMPLNT